MFGDGRRAAATAVVTLILLGVALATGVDDRVLYPLLPWLVLCLAVNRGRVARLFGGNQVASPPAPMLRQLLGKAWA